MNSHANRISQNHKTKARNNARPASPAPIWVETLESRTLLSGGADLSLSLSGPASVTAGENVTYVLTTVNNGTAIAKGITYAPTRGYPAGILQVSFVLDSGPAAKLAPGQTNVYTLVLSVDPSIASGTVLNFPETVSTTSNDINLANNTATTSTPVTASADTNLVVTGPAEVNAGSATFSFMTFNAGPSAEPS